MKLTFENCNNMLMYTYLRLSIINRVNSEYEAKDSFVDIAPLRNKLVNTEYYTIYDAKYIEKIDYAKASEVLVQQRQSKTAAQIGKYAHTPEFAVLPKLKQWSLYLP